MIYKAKEGSKAYEYVRGIIEAEKKEKESYLARVDQSVGFEVKQFSGYRPNKTFIRKLEITALLVDKLTWESLDKKVWKFTKMVENLFQIVPNKRTKKGKEIATVFNSFKPVTTHWDIHQNLGVKEPGSKYFSIVQLSCNREKNVYFVCFDDSVRADKDNSDLVEITMSEYDKLMENSYEKDKV